MLGLVSVLHAQRLSTNENGEKIVLFDDGSWRYYDPAQDAELEEAVPTNNRPPLEEAVSPEAAENPLVNPPGGTVGQSKKRTKKNRSGKADGKADKAAAKAAKKARKEAAKLAKADPDKKQKKPGKKTVKTKVAKSSPNKASRTEDPQAQQRSDELARQRAARAAAAVVERERALEDLSLDRVFLEEELRQAYASLESTDEDIAAIEAKLRAAREQEEGAREAYKAALDESKEYERLVNMPYEKREKLLAKRAASDPRQAALDGGDLTASPEQPISKEAQKVADEIRGKRLATDVMVYPPSAPCKVDFDGIDEFTGKPRRDLSPTEFFSYTNAQMRDFFKEKDFIQCSGALSAVGNSVFLLSLDLEVASQNAQRDYGFIEKGSILTVKFIDGSTVRIPNRRTDMGTLNPLEKSVIYKPQYSISAAQAKEMSEGEVDKIRIVWSSGYEDYEVYELDFFINQFRCLAE